MNENIIPWKAGWDHIYRFFLQFFGNWLQFRHIILEKKIKLYNLEK